MLCPACKNDMIVVEYQRIELDFCPNCRGVWFDAGELDLMLGAANLNDKFLGDLQHLPAAKTNEAVRKCPICRKGMSKNLIGAKPPIIVDICRRGDGLFFDGGEVNQLIKQLPAAAPEKPGTKHPVTDFLSDVFKSSD